MLHLAFLDQVLHRSSDVFDWHVRVNTVLIEEIDGIDLEPLERALGGLLDVLWPAVQARRTLHPAGIEIGTEIEPEFGGNHHLPAERSEGFAHEFFVCVRTVNFSCVKERNAALHRRVEKRDHLLFVFGRTVRKAHTHAAEPDRRYFQITFSKSALLHV